MTNGLSDIDDCGIANPPVGGEYNFEFSAIRSFRTAWQAVAIVVPFVPCANLWVA